MKAVTIRSMVQSARIAISRAADTTSGTYILVGWDGAAIAGGMKARLTLPHERVNVPKGATLEEVVVEMTLAAHRLKAVMPAALAAYDPAANSRASNKSRMAFGKFKRRGK